MLWTRVVGALVVLIVASFAVQWVLPRGARGSRLSARQYLMWDIAPLVGFFGALLLVLSLVEGERLAMLYAWAWGGVVGVVASISLWMASIYTGGLRPAPALPAKKESVFRVAWRFIRTFGIMLVVTAVGLNIAIRLLGAVVEVFFAAAFGVLILAMALLVFARSRSRVPDSR